MYGGSSPATTTTLLKIQPMNSLIKSIIDSTTLSHSPPTTSSMHITDNDATQVYEDINATMEYGGMEDDATQCYTSINPTTSSHLPPTTLSVLDQTQLYDDDIEHTNNVKMNISTGSHCNDGATQALNYENDVVEVW